MARAALLLMAVPALLLGAALQAHGVSYDPESLPPAVVLAPGDIETVRWTVTNPGSDAPLDVVVSLSGPGARYVELGGGAKERTFTVGPGGALAVPLVIGAPASGTHRVTVHASDAARQPDGRMESTPGAFQALDIVVRQQSTEAVADVAGGAGGTGAAAFPRPAPRSSGGGGGSSDAPAPGPADIYFGSVSWDCRAGTVRATVGPESADVAVSVRTTELGLQRAEDAGAEGGYRVFESRMSPDDTIIMVHAVPILSGGLFSITESVRVDECAGEAVLDFRQAAAPAAPDQPAEPAPAPAPAPEPDPRGEIPPPPPPRAPGEPPADAEAPQAGPAPAPPGAGDAPGGGCLIATAAHGTELAPRVQALREARDGALSSGGAGAQIMGALHSAYYSFSPAAADLQREHPELREAARLALEPALRAAQAAAGLGAGR